EYGTQTTDIENMLDKLRTNDSRTVTPHETKMSTGVEARKINNKHIDFEILSDSDVSSARGLNRSSTSELYTPATESFDDREGSVSAEMEKVKKELELAKSLIDQQKRELEETRSLRHTMEQAVATPSEAEFGRTDPRVAAMQSAFDASRPYTGGNWLPYESQPEPTTTGLNHETRRAFGRAGQRAAATIDLHGTRDHRAPTHPAEERNFRYGAPPVHAAQRTFSSGSVMSQGAPYADYHNITMPGLAARSAIPGYNSGHGYVTPLELPLSPTLPFATTIADPMYNNFLLNNRALPSHLMPTSPMQTSFDLGQGMGLQDSFAASAQTYVSPLEPMNYRRLLDKSVSCDWKYIVDKIVCNNDQQASIFLQQKLKVGTAEQKFDIVEAIINQAYPLMINRFGNFLVQRCFEHSTPDQVVAIADAIHGNVISLSMDPFGCHVIQKAFDSVPESHKADMVRELLRRIPDTVIHRYACHVWQKLFELRWSAEPPQIMCKVIDALGGMWHEVALGETGSLVVQNIFENCVEEEKRPAIEEVISSIDLIAHGQFGNWCIQHLCEHAAPADKRRVIDHILVNAYSYSIDQYASKVVEKCLKISGIEFLDRYLTVITTAHPDRPRIPLIDISSDQY
ncbi:hypothetical protein LTR66_017872, partial [Elasticomyces elasticus]